MTSSLKLPVTLALRSFSLVDAFRVASALALPRSSNFRNLPSARTMQKPLFEHESAQSLVWLARSLFLQATCTMVPVQVSARASAAERDSPAMSFFVNRLLGF